MLKAVGIAIGVGLLATWQPAGAQEAWQTEISKALGKSGAAMPGNVYRVGLPRTDISATVDGIPIRPGFALGSWLAFMPHGGDTMVMGDLVLTDDEINPVMKRLFAGGVQVTALHNHLLRNTPHTMYLHVEGHGEPGKLAAALREALAQSFMPLTDSPPPARAPPPEFDTAAIDAAMGRKGKLNGGVYQFSIPRHSAPTESRAPIPEAMGSAIAINFQQAGRGEIARTGDFVLTANEVNAVAASLRDNDVDVTAIHNHMLNDEPRLFFMHFWAHGSESKIAQAMAAALKHIDVAAE
jgi:hypothetical protein